MVSCKDAAMNQIVFALGTGRCGTKTLCHLFKQLPQVASYHEPKPHLSRVASFRLHLQPYNVQATIRSARKMLLEASDQQRYYLESALWNTWLIDDLAAVFPQAKFLWLTRDIYTWAQSCYRRGWYDPACEVNQERFARMRPTPPPGWPAGVSRWFKLGYYWGLYNIHAETRLKACGAPWKRVAVEELDNLLIVNYVKAWCGFPGEVTEVRRENCGADRITLAELQARGIYDEIEDAGLRLDALCTPSSWVSVSYLKSLGLRYDFMETNPITPQIVADLQEGVDYAHGTYKNYYQNFSVSRPAAAL